MSPKNKVSHNDLFRGDDDLTEMPKTKAGTIKLLERASGRKVENENNIQLQPANPIGSLLVGIGIIALFLVFAFLGYCLITGF